MWAAPFRGIRLPKPIYRGLFRQVTFRVKISFPRSRRSARQVEELVEAFRIRGLSKAAFSRQHRIVPSCRSRNKSSVNLAQGGWIFRDWEQGGP
jgi:hypothetical protein